MSVNIEDKLEQLHTLLLEMGSVAVAFSGGVDSSLLLKAAHRALGDGAVGVLAVSPSLPRSEREEALALADEIGVRLEVLTTHETADEDYAKNAPNRCYFCKENVYAALSTFAQQRGIPYVLDGMNLEDTLDVRPGRAAAVKHGVRSPLHELGFRKQDVRDAALKLGLRNWDKPAAACLASRVPYGTRVTDDLLHRIEAAEVYVKSLGFADLRVRHHGDVARIELPKEEILQAVELQEMLVGGLKALGWLYVTLDLAGLCHGSMNAPLKTKKPTVAVTA